MPDFTIDIVGTVKDNYEISAWNKENAEEMARKFFRDDYHDADIVAITISERTSEKNEEV